MATLHALFSDAGREANRRRATVALPSGLASQPASILNCHGMNDVGIGRKGETVFDAAGISALYG
jgi:hypothetical protein